MDDVGGELEPDSTTSTVSVIILDQQDAVNSKFPQDTNQQVANQDFHNGLSVEQFSCNQCGKCLRDPHTLKCHIKTVHGEKKFSCQTCNKKFPHKGALNAHLKTHNEASFTCNICKETIKDSSYFKKHVRSHSGNRPHECPVCGKSYIQKSHLTVHMSIHSDYKPYSCDICFKSFRLAKGYKEHRNMHLNIKNLKCSHCSYTTCFQKNLQTHVRNHLKDKKPKVKKGKNSSQSCKIEEYTTEPPIENETKEPLISTTAGCQDPLGEIESPVYLLVNLETEENLAIQDMETLNPLEMAQELCITTQPDKLGQDYRPLDLSIVPTDNSKISIKLHQSRNIFCEESTNTSDATSFENLTATLSSTNYTSTSDRSGAESPTDITADQYLAYQAENQGRRRSVFLAEQLDYEHQGEMRVVDPAEVTG